MDSKLKLPCKWEKFLSDSIDFDRFYFQLFEFLKGFGSIIPEPELIFNVFNYVDPEGVRCVLYGEDPYPRVTSACGISFWDKEVTAWEDRTRGNSVKNILKGLLIHKKKVGFEAGIDECRRAAKENGLLSPADLFLDWLDMGVLMINSSLTFSTKDDKKKHFNFWKEFHTILINKLNRRENSPRYILWGGKAAVWQKEIEKNIDRCDKIIRQAHPAFGYQFFKKKGGDFSPFSEITEKTEMKWI